MYGGIYTLSSFGGYKMLPAWFCLTGPIYFPKHKKLKGYQKSKG